MITEFPSALALQLIPCTCESGPHSDAVIMDARLAGRKAFINCLLFKDQPCKQLKKAFDEGYTLERNGRPDHEPSKRKAAKDLF